MNGRITARAMALPSLRKAGLISTRAITVSAAAEPTKIMRNKVIRLVESAVAYSCSHRQQTLMNAYAQVFGLTRLPYVYMPVRHIFLGQFCSVYASAAPGDGYGLWDMPKWQAVAIMDAFDDVRPIAMLDISASAEGKRMERHLMAGWDKLPRVRKQLELSSDDEIIAPMDRLWTVCGGAHEEFIGAVKDAIRRRLASHPRYAQEAERWRTVVNDNPTFTYDLEVSL